MTTRVAFIGAGGVARRHLDVLARLGDVEVAGVVDVVDEAARRFATDCGARAYPSVDALLDDGRVDAAYICVPPFAHGEPERAALARRIPFFVEKPLGADLAVAEEIAREVEELDLLTGTGYHWRCLDTVALAQQHLRERPAVLASGYWLDKRPPVAWWNDRASSGGQVVEQLTHVLDLARVLLGEVVEVHAVASTPPAEQGAGRSGDVEDATAATARLASGAVATFAATSVLRAKHRAELHTFSEGLVLELTETTLTVDDGTTRHTVEPAEDPRQAVDREFLEALRGERAATRAPYGEALRTHRLACAIAESVRTGRTVQLAGTGHGPSPTTMRPAP